MTCLKHFYIANSSNRIECSELSVCLYSNLHCWEIEWFNPSFIGTYLVPFQWLIFFFTQFTSRVTVSVCYHLLWHIIAFHHLIKLSKAKCTTDLALNRSFFSVTIVFCHVTFTVWSFKHHSYISPSRTISPASAKAWKMPCRDLTSSFPSPQQGEVQRWPTHLRVSKTHLVKAPRLPDSNQRCRPAT